jgi:hypothetical protein
VNACTSLGGVQCDSTGRVNSLCVLRTSLVTITQSSY